MVDWYTLANERECRVSSVEAKLLLPHPPTPTPRPALRPIMDICTVSSDCHVRLACYLSGVVRQRTPVLFTVGAAMICSHPSKSQHGFIESVLGYGHGRTKRTMMVCVCVFCHCVLLVFSLYTWDTRRKCETIMIINRTLGTDTFCIRLTGTTYKIPWMKGDLFEHTLPRGRERNGTTEWHMWREDNKTTQWHVIRFDLKWTHPGGMGASDRMKRSRTAVDNTWTGSIHSNHASASGYRLGFTHVR